MNDNATNVILERHKRIERLVARWDELKRERTTGKETEATPPEVDDDERREVLWLTSPAPYPGLRSFGPDETALFFARQAQTDGLVQRLAKSNIMVVLGGSGCGKSSLVRAGLIPRLTTSASVPGLKGRWYVVEFRPGLDPSTALVDGFRDSIVAPVARFAPPQKRVAGACSAMPKRMRCVPPASGLKVCLNSPVTCSIVSISSSRAARAPVRLIS
jgi:hypothetical protein